MRARSLARDGGLQDRDGLVREGVETVEDFTSGNVPDRLLKAIEGQVAHVASDGPRLETDAAFL